MDNQPTEMELSDRLVAAFGLSPAELRVAHIVASGRNLKHAAKELGRSHDTMRAQLKSILAKTNTRRQSALAVLIVRMEYAAIKEYNQ